jgi:hypothetical protein
LLGKQSHYAAEMISSFTIAYALQILEQPIETDEYQSVDGTKAEFLWRTAAQDIDLLPQRPNLYLERYSRPEQVDKRPTNKFAKIPHPTKESPASRSTARRLRFADRRAALVERRYDEKDSELSRPL